MSERAPNARPLLLENVLDCPSPSYPHIDTPSIYFYSVGVTIIKIVDFYTSSLHLGTSTVYLIITFILYPSSITMRPVLLWLLAHPLLNEKGSHICPLYTQVAGRPDPIISP
jgi:hypothetical protein